MYLSTIAKQFKQILRVPTVPEEKKPIIRNSFKLALLRGLVHIIPVSLSIVLIIINIRGVYIGPSLGNDDRSTTYTLAALQFAAKVQVLLVKFESSTFLVC